MLTFPHQNVSCCLYKSRPRRVFKSDERLIWQSWFEDLVRSSSIISLPHALDNVRTGRIDQRFIDKLKEPDQWYVWAKESGTDDNYLTDPDEKLLIRYYPPGSNPGSNCFEVAGAVTISRPINIVTMFFNSYYFRASQ